MLYVRVTEAMRRPSGVVSPTGTQIKVGLKFRSYQRHVSRAQLR